MDAREETQSLREDPLPPVAIMDPLTQVYYIDQKIATLHEQIAELSTQRLTLMEYAVSNHIEQDDLCRLVARVTPPVQKVDIEKLRAEKPEIIETIQKWQRLFLVERVREQFRTLGTAITHAELKRAIPQKAVFESFLYRPGEPRISYEVVKRDV